MPETKRERRDAARTARIAAEQQEQQAAARKRRLGIAGGLLVAAVAAVAVAIALSSSGGSSAASSGSVTGADEVLSQYRGIPQDGLTLGDPAAPALIVAFVHPKCPVCRDYELSEVPEIVEQLVRPGKARMQLLTMDFQNIGADSVLGGEAFYGAALQDKLFEFAGIDYRNQGEESDEWITPARMRAFAAAIPGLDGERMLDDGASPRGKRLREQTYRLVERLAVDGTPAVFVGRDLASLERVDLTAASAERAVAGLN